LNPVHRCPWIKCKGAGIDLFNQHWPACGKNWAFLLLHPSPDGGPATSALVSGVDASFLLSPRGESASRSKHEKLRTPICRTYQWVAKIRLEVVVELPLLIAVMRPNVAWAKFAVQATSRRRSRPGSSSTAAYRKARKLWLNGSAFVDEALQDLSRRSGAAGAKNALTSSITRWLGAFPCPRSPVPSSAERHCSSRPLNCTILLGSFKTDRPAEGHCLR
jgi:hypothetical protein